MARLLTLANVEFDPSSVAGVDLASLNKDALLLGALQQPHGREAGTGGAGPISDDESILSSSEELDQVQLQCFFPHLFAASGAHAAAAAKLPIPGFASICKLTCIHSNLCATVVLQDVRVKEICIHVPCTIIHGHRVTGSWMPCRVYLQP